MRKDIHCQQMQGNTYYRFHLLHQLVWILHTKSLRIEHFLEAVEVPAAVQLVAFSDRLRDASAKGVDPGIQEGSPHDLPPLHRLGRTQIKGMCRPDPHAPWTRSIARRAASQCACGCQRSSSRSCSNLRNASRLRQTAQLWEIGIQDRLNSTDP